MSEQPLKSEGFHPVAEIFPLMQGDAYNQLVADISANGLREPIWLYQKKIIDGRNRFRACTAAMVEPTYREYDGKPEELVNFVLSLNLHRRHLSESQRAMVAAKIANLNHGDNQYTTKECSIEHSTPAVTVEAAATQLNVSPMSVRRAKKVKDHGAPELVAAVDRGDVSVSAAAVIAEHKPEVQRELVAAGPKAVVREAKRLEESTSDRKTDDRHGLRTARMSKVADLIAELVELSNRPHHRFPFIQIKQKVNELSETFSKSFGL
jgi:ParB family chromosome partitioning protein